MYWSHQSHKEAVKSTNSNLQKEAQHPEGYSLQINKKPTEVCIEQEAYCTSIWTSPCPPAAAIKTTVSTRYLHLWIFSQGLCFCVSCFFWLKEHCSLSHSITHQSALKYVVSQCEDDPWCIKPLRHIMTLNDKHNGELFHIKSAEPKDSLVLFTSGW